MEMPSAGGGGGRGKEIPFPRTPLQFQPQHGPIRPEAGGPQEAVEEEKEEVEEEGASGWEGREHLGWAEHAGRRGPRLPRPGCPRCPRLPLPPHAPRGAGGGGARRVPPATFPPPWMAFVGDLQGDRALDTCPPWAAPAPKFAGARPHSAAGRA